MAYGMGEARRSWRDPRRQRTLALRWLLANALLPLLVLGVLLDNDAVGAARLDETATVIAAVVGYGLALALWRVWRRTQRYEAPTAMEAMAADPRPPVLYLRSFRDDGHAPVADVRIPILRRLYSALQLTTPEQHCADELEALGPVIAIGKPGEPLPELGAARLYVGHDVWQQEVLRLMRSAVLVVVRVGASPGVLWEIEQALSVLPRERLVLARFGGSDVAPEIVQRLQPVLGASWAATLPPQRGPIWRELLFGSESARQVGALVCFPIDHADAVVVPVRWGRGWRGRFTMLALLSVFDPLHEAWREVFDRIALPIRRPNVSRVKAIALALSMGWCGAHWFYLGNKRRGWLFVIGLPLLFIGWLVAWVDAVRFLRADRAEFESRFVTHHQLRA
jgi:TM2 domain-containing membrane protein YozV